MRRMVEGHYEGFPQHGQRDLSAYFEFPANRYVGQEMRLKHVKMQTPRNRVLGRINLEPVHVVKEANELTYDSRMMEKGKGHHVVWDGERFMLVKGDDGVAIYRFEENGD